MTPIHPISSPSHVPATVVDPSLSRPAEQNELSSQFTFSGVDAAAALRLGGDLRFTHFWNSRHWGFGIGAGLRGEGRLGGSSSQFDVARGLWVGQYPLFAFTPYIGASFCAFPSAGLNLCLHSRGIVGVSLTNVIENRLDASGFFVASSSHGESETAVGLEAGTGLSLHPHPRVSFGLEAAYHYTLHSEGILVLLGSRFYF